MESTATDVNRTYHDDWQGGTNQNVVVSEGLTITNMPIWDENDDMSNWGSSGWASRLSIPFAQTPEGARVECSGDSAALVKEYSAFQFPQTIEFIYRLLSPSAPQTGFNTKASIHLIETRNNQSSRFSIGLNEATDWTWVSIVITSPASGESYIQRWIDTISLIWEPESLQI
ncbi:hypothetical protein [Thermoactinomyces sp. DSM 45892]|uniref:hypothetical protein n=1 Tax=Thermoactinomyces sp. DSM 45892 TaxID=1882753 RepID=UPI00089A681B|nr:hypothetical protein [Thermoactinomyces sp. DSM 45892]SDY13024.1 hypothetical protein SAMN05444416_10286 [Thermoactinomyces sp. DSM 45892]